MLFFNVDFDDEWAFYRQGVDSLNAGVPVLYWIDRFDFNLGSALHFWTSHALNPHSNSDTP
jgi:hypothetical protein